MVGRSLRLSVGIRCGLTLLLGAIPIIAIIAGLATFAILTVVVWLAALRRFQAIERTMEIRFPPPPPG